MAISIIVSRLQERRQSTLKVVWLQRITFPFSSLPPLLYSPSSVITLISTKHFLARSFADGGDVQNESGILLGTNWTVTRGLLVMAYTDIAYFPILVTVYIRQVRHGITS